MNILIVDDNAEFSSTLSEIVSAYGWNPTTLNTPESALAYLERHHYDVHIMLLDIEFDHRSAMNGLDVLERSVKNYPAIPVIMISGKGTIETAVRATKLGALNFIEKSMLSHERLIDVLRSASERISQTDNVRDMLRIIEQQGIIGASKAMQQVADKIIRYGRTELNVIITGETGTGKKLVARALHNVSKRAKQPFVTVDIPNIPRELFQSELFGHVRGAFSGALQDKKGLFHQADKGTLFLDEIGDMPQESQAYLLLPIEEKTIRRVGSIEAEPIDVRFISATDRDLIQSMKNSTFREQLYHRLRECEITIPPLSERKEDIPLIVDHYVQRHNREHNDHKICSPSAVEYLQNREWKGNVRELSSMLRVTLQTSSNEVLEVSDLHSTVHTSFGSTTTIQSGTAPDVISLDRTRREDLERVDKMKLEAMLQSCNGNVSKAAAQLGISRETLHVKIRKYDIDTHKFRKK